MNVNEAVKTRYRVEILDLYDNIWLQMKQYLVPRRKQFIQVRIN